jgi:nitroreductase
MDKCIVKRCTEQAVLAPNSSNIQLWEFYQITSKALITKIAPLFLTAKYLIPFPRILFNASCAYK